MGSLPHGQLQQNQLPDAQLENEDPLSGLWETNWPSYYTGTAVEDWSSFGNIQAPQSATYLGEYNNSRSFILSDESNDLSHLPLRYLSDSSAFYNPLLAFPSPTNLSSSLDQANLQDPISWSSGLNNFSSQGHHWINKSTNSLPPKLSPNNRLLSADTNTVGDGSSETTIEIFKSLDLPYNQLVYRALTSTENYRMTTDEIYKWFEKNTEKVKSRNWKRSVRSTLTDFLVCDHAHIIPLFLFYDRKVGILSELKLMIYPVCRLFNVSRSRRPDTGN